MLSKEETKKLGYLGGKIIYKDPVTGKKKSVIVDAENCGLLTKEEEDRILHNGRKGTKLFSEVEETNKYKKTRDLNP